MSRRYLFFAYVFLSSIIVQYMNCDRNVQFSFCTCWCNIRR